MFPKFEVVSPHNLLPITCSRKRWRHAAEHREIKGQLDVVKRVLQAPLAVYQSDTDPDRHVFYRPSELPAPNNHGYVRVVVDYRTKTRGTLVTALHVSGPKAKEVVIWSTGMPPLKQ